ncbi:BadF/BadG/BcrA/BcrD ATPase family protein [Streptosporangium sp. NPDC023963]|uniref:N-acetylglucosamine kinase n=1 Tax=Streptosporangium sp. NPDC023963 TaxID=3155608 RepID=UPI00341D72FF
MIAGFDVGGTKTHVRLVEGQSVRHDRVVSSEGWSALPVEHAASWLCALLPGEPVEALVVGAQGCEDRAHCAALRDALVTRVRAPVTVVNDAELLLPAAGLERGVALIAGTGAIAVYTDGEHLIRAGGWGWVLDDDGSASALVREAARAVLARADRGEEPDELGLMLLESTGAPDPAALAHSLSWGTGPERWGLHSPAVVAAAAAGSAAARRILDEGARSLAGLVVTLAGRGVPVEDVVVAGGLVTNVPEYWAAVHRLLGQWLPSARTTLLDRPPVEGAITRARWLLEGA